MANTIDNNLLESLNLTRQTEQKKNDELGQSDFLELMTAQLNNQDPMKPMEGGEFFNQIAQFSAVSGIQELQTSFQQVANAMYSSQTLQASAMVGRSVLIPTATAGLAEGGTLSGSADLPASTSRLVVGVFDASGQLVRRMDLGSHNAGDVRFVWDGKTDSGDDAPSGVYEIKAEAMIDGNATALDTALAAKVESVSMGNQAQGITLNLAGRDPIGLASVKQIM